MLLKNDEIVKFTYAESKTIKEQVGGKESVTFKLVNSLGRVQKNGNLKHKVRHVIPSVYMTTDKSGNSIEVRYYKTKAVSKRNNVSEVAFTPEFVSIERGEITIRIGADQKENMDLFFWFMGHPRRAGNKEGDGSKRPLFYLVNNNLDALEYEQKQEALSQMKNLLWNPENRIGDDNIRTIGRALAIEGIDDMNTAAVRLAIEKKCEKTPNQFLAYKDLGGEANLRATIQIAQEVGVLVFNKAAYTWRMFDATTGISAELCVTRVTDNPTTSLVHFFSHIDDGGNLERVMELVAIAKTPTVKPPLFTKKVPEKIILEKLDVDQLKAIANEMGITYNHMSKTKRLIELLNEQTPPERIYWEEPSAVL